MNSDTVTQYWFVVVYSRYYSSVLLCHTWIICGYVVVIAVAINILFSSSLFTQGAEYLISKIGHINLVLPIQVSS